MLPTGNAIRAGITTAAKTLASRTGRLSRAAAKTFSGTALPDSTASRLPMKPTAKQPFSSQERWYAHLAHSPTQKTHDEDGSLRLQAGHVGLGLDSAELLELAELLQDPELKSAVLRAAAAGRPLLVSQSPDLADDARRAETIRTRDGSCSYVNKDRAAAGKIEPHAVVKPEDGPYIGKLTRPFLAVVAKWMESEEFKRYSLAGSEREITNKKLWTEAETVQFVKHGVVPTWPPNCCDFLKRLVGDFAKVACPQEDTRARFMEALARCTHPQEVVQLAKDHFRPDAQGAASFDPHPPQPQPSESDEYWKAQLHVPHHVASALPPELETAAAVMKAKRNFAAFKDAFDNASGLSEQVFTGLAARLQVDGVFFEPLFGSDDARQQQWGLRFFQGLGERLRPCKDNEAVACVFYFGRTYAPDTTHIAVMAVDRNGQTSFSHHESMEVARNAKPVDNLMPGFIGVPTNTFDTRQHHERLLGKAGVPERVPIRVSYDLTGPPTGQFVVLRDFRAFVRFNDTWNEEGLRRGREWPYATDIDHTGLEITAAARRGWNSDEDLEKLKKGRWSMETPLPPGETDQSLAGHYSNNCAVWTLRAVKAGGGLPEDAKVGGDMDLSDAGRALFRHGLMPDTDPDLFRKMDQAGTVLQVEGNGDPAVGRFRITRHPASFFGMGGLAGESSRPDLVGRTGEAGTAYPAHVRRIEQEGDESARQKAAQKLADQARKNPQTFDRLSDPGKGNPQ